MQSTRHDASLAALQASSGFPGQVLDVVVLSADAGLLATLREASGAEHAIWHAQSADVAVDLLVGGRCAILIADLGTLRGDAAALLERLHAQFPELILLGTGRRDEEGAVAALVSGGVLYRFLHKPVSPARANLFLTAATRRYSELRNIQPIAHTTAKTIVTRPHRGTMVAAGAVALAIVVAFTVWAVRDEPGSAETLQHAMPAVTAEEEIADHLARAEMAFATGRISEPRRDNALEHFRAVLALQPDHAQARAGVQRVSDALETRVVLALQARNAAQGAIAFTALRRAIPDHPRLDALQAQLLSVSRSARPLPSQTSAVRLTTAPTVAPASQSQTPRDRAPETASPPVEHVRRANTPAGATPLRQSAAPRPDELAAIGALRERGALIEPAGENAYDRLLVLRELYPQATEVQAEQQRLAFALLERTRTALAASDIESAATYAARAETVVPGMATTRTLREQIAAAQQQRAFMSNIVPATALERVREVAPVYPRDAQRAGVEGWVDVEFTVATDGTTRDLVVRDAQPRDVFDKSAVDSVKRWRFEPVQRNGAAVPQRATMRIRFELK